MKLTPSQMLAAGVGDANVEPLYTVTVTVTQSQLSAVETYLGRARADLAAAITAPTCSPKEEEWMTQALAVIGQLAGRLQEAKRIPLPPSQPRRPEDINRPPGWRNGWRRAWRRSA